MQRLIHKREYTDNSCHADPAIYSIFGFVTHLCEVLMMAPGDIVPISFDSALVALSYFIAVLG